MTEPRNVNVENGNEAAIPPIAAAFLVNFDHRKGYTLAWQKSIDGVQVEGVVEFKSLPSGLHSVEEDLIYFIHEDYAGLSAFLNLPDEQSERRAQMLAVGVLVPLEHGRIGRSWRHAEGLKDLARSQIKDIKDFSRLEDYWERYRCWVDAAPVQGPNESSESLGQPEGHRKSRSMSTVTTSFHSTHYLTPHHPATTLLEAIKLFGPLIFPVYRAALLRKRILVVTEAPVEFSCNFVYNLSILSSVPRNLTPALSSSDIPNLRLRPLFNVGVSDIPSLKRQHTGAGSHVISKDGWIACTTDDILTTKPDLYDVLVLLPSSTSPNDGTKVFPRIINSNAALSNTFPKTSIKSTRRDFHRYIHLQQGLHRLSPSHAKADNTTSEEDDISTVASQSSSYSADKTVVEPSSWSRMAYTSLVWWASAGDRRGGFAEAEELEMQQDSSLLDANTEDGKIREVALVAYFHHLTSIMFATIAEALARADGQESEGESYHDEPSDDSSLDQEPTDSPTPIDEDAHQRLLTKGQAYEVDIMPEEMTSMGLDSWSTSDKTFVEDLVYLWWGRRAKVRAAPIECCGLRIL